MENNNTNTNNKDFFWEKAETQSKEVYTDEETLVTDLELDLVLNHLTDVYGTRGELLQIGFQDREMFVKVFGSEFR